MGWSSCKQSKSQAVIEILGDHNYVNSKGEKRSVRKHVLRGSQLWMINDVFSLEGSLLRSFISLSLIEGRGFGAGHIGHKEMSEHSHPFYYNVPLGWLDEVPVPRVHPELMALSQGAVEWRAAVRAQADAKNKALSKAAFKVGDRIRLSERYKVRDYVLQYKVKSSWRASVAGGGLVYRLGPKALAGAELVA